MDDYDRFQYGLALLRGDRPLPPGDADRLTVAYVFDTELKRLQECLGGNHKLRMIPFVCADELPPNVVEYCVERDHPVHCDSAVVEVDLEDNNPLFLWLKSQGYQFSPKEIDRGWGHIGLMGS